MSATSGRDQIVSGELKNNLDAKGKKIINADLSDSSNTFPSSGITVPSTLAVLSGNGGGLITTPNVAISTVANGAVITIADGKVATVSNTLTLAGTDGSTLDVGTGGTLGTAAYTAASAYATSAQGTKADNVAAVNGLVKCNGSGTFDAATAKTDYWDTTVAVASGASHAKGLVPDPGASSGTSKFLCEDMTYRVPPASTGVTIANTLLVIKGDNAGGGVAATPGNATGDYVAPSTALGRLLAGTTALSGVTPTVNWNTTTSFSHTLSGNTTYTFSNVTDGFNISLAVTNTASNYTVTWPAGIVWQGGVAPTQTTGAKTDFYGFDRKGSITYGAVIANMS